MNIPENITDQIKSILLERDNLSTQALYIIGQSKYGWNFGSVWSEIFETMEQEATKIAGKRWTLNI